MSQVRKLEHSYAMLGIGLLLLIIGLLIISAEGSAGQIASPLYSVGLAFLFGGLATLAGFVTDYKVVTTHNQIATQIDGQETVVRSILDKLDGLEKKIDKLNES